MAEKLIRFGGEGKASSPKALSALDAAIMTQKEKADLGAGVDSG